MGILSFPLKGGRAMPAELHTTLTPDTPVRYLKGYSKEKNFFLCIGYIAFVSWITY